ncbi:MAG: DUF3429 domain-containing protein [Rubricella sp.]
MTDIPRPALILGFAGLLPFLWGALLVLFPMTFPTFGVTFPGAYGGQVLLLRYGTIILAFMAGCLWGFAAQRGRRPAWTELIVSVLPAIWLFFALAFPGTAGLWALLGGFVALLGADLMFAHRGIAPAWWMALRIPLTVIVSACLLVGALA